MRNPLGGRYAADCGLAQNARHVNLHETDIATALTNVFLSKVRWHLKKPEIIWWAGVVLLSHPTLSRSIGSAEFCEVSLS